MLLHQVRVCRNRSDVWTSSLLPATLGSIDLCGKTLAPKKSRRQQADTLTVLRTSPVGTLVVRGGIEMSSRSVLLLEGHGAYFQDITFSGVRLGIKRFTA